MQVDFETLLKYEEDGKLRHSKHPDRDLHVWCYAAGVPYSREWDEITMLCRGLVTDGEGNVLSRPFRKFFNWGDPFGPGPEVTQGPFWAYDKEDGTMIVVGLDADGERIVSTKGSFKTWHSEKAAEMLGDWEPEPGTTAIFEFIHPENRIVVDYGEFAGLVLIGAVNNTDGSDHYRPERYAETSGWKGGTAVPRQFNLQSMLNTIKDPENGPNREGFVLVWPNNGAPSPRVKIKFAQYMNLHFAMARISNVAIWEALKEGTFDAMLEEVPDEIFDRVRECADELSATAHGVYECAVMAARTAQEAHDGRREQAGLILSIYPDMSGLVFGVLDGKDIMPKVWDRIRPDGTATWPYLR